MRRTRVMQGLVAGLVIAALVGLLWPKPAIGQDLTTMLSTFLRSLYAGKVDTAQSTLTLRAGGTDRWTINSSGHLVAAADSTYDIGAAGAYPRAIYGNTLYSNGDVASTNAAATAGSGTGVSVVTQGALRDGYYAVTVASTQFISAAVTHDVTIATLPAKTQLLGVIADLTQAFNCASVCTGTTLSMTLGTAAGGTQVLASFDADAAAAQFGDADAELGTGMQRAAMIQGGLFGSWSATTPISLRLTSGTGNLGTGAATNLSQGSVTFYLVTRRF